MISFIDTDIQNIVLHKVGNKVQNENIIFSKEELSIGDEIREILLDYFLSPFKSEEYYTFFHESDLLLNEVYNYVSNIFENRNSFYDQSVNLAKHLHERSTHPNIKNGEFYVAYLKDCILDGEELDAIGLFKSETKDSFLKVFPTENSFDIQVDEGIDIKRLDKGCIIFNTEKENGYVVASIDNINKSEEARYWIDEFLKIKSREDNYYHTQNVMNFCRSFVKDQMPEEYEVNKADQAIMMNKTVDFLKEKDEFHFNEFIDEVFEEPELKESVKAYKANYENQNEVELFDDFDLSDQAIKKQSRVFKSVIKLDKNFHIYVHGKRQYIQKGYDEEKGMHFYQIYFNEEH